MNIETILNPSRTQHGVTGSSKKRVLENIANIISEDISSIDSNQLFDSLIARERLGTTGLGNGIAIPHCRNANCDTIIGSLIKLAEPVDFDAIDNQPVDLLFVLLVPEQANDEHLQALATIAEMFGDEEFCKQLRDCENDASLYELAISH